MTHLYLVRHGEATTQVSNLLLDEGLTSLGIIQAEHLRDRLAATREIIPDVLIASTLPRARQTAEIIAPALNQSISLDDEMQELREGKATGMKLEQAQMKYGHFNPEQEPFRPPAPGGESWGQFTLRVAAALDRITSIYEGKTIVIVCHGGVIESSFIYFFRMESFAPPQTDFEIHNTSITYWQKSDSKDQSSEQSPHWRIIRYNDDFHLRDIDSLTRINWKDFGAPTPQEKSESRQSLPTTER